MPRARKGAQRALSDEIPSRSGAPRPSGRECRSPLGTRALLRAVAIVLPVLALTSGLPAPVAAQDLTGRELDRRVAPDLQPGTTFADHGISVRVPQPGGFVWGELKYPDGTWQEVGVETARDGRVFVLGQGSERAAVLQVRDEQAALGIEPTAVLPAAAGTQGTGATNECRDTFRNLYWWRTPRLDWRFNPARTPAYLRDDDGSTRSVVAALVRAQDNVTGVANLCSHDDKVSAKGGYLGLTRHHVDVSGHASCMGGDGRSVIEFASLPAYSVAMTCVYGIRRHVAVEADIRINDSSARWALDQSGCTGRQLLIEAAMTHEFGHVYGLAHASTYRDPWLTMQPLIRACNQGPSSLGIGDMLGLEKKY